MGLPARTEIKVADFRGMSTNIDPSDLPPGLAEEQINLNGQKRGELSLRRGLRPIEFDAEES